MLEKKNMGAEAKKILDELKMSDSTIKTDCRFTFYDKDCVYDYDAYSPMMVGKIIENLLKREDSLYSKLEKLLDKPANP